MMKKNKGKILLSSAVILLPVLFGILMWNRLPGRMITHWGADGQGDGFSRKAFAVFGLPLFLLAGHLLCLFITSLDQKQKGQNKKALEMIFWIIPFTSLFASGVIYSAALGTEWNLKLLFPALFGAMFLFIGNYLPKIKQNRTLGIKVSWTLNNEENWNKTHRFGGKLWVICGLIMIFSIFLPSPAALWIFPCLILTAAILPILYSYLLYRAHQKEGIIYEASPKSKGEKIALRITAILVPLIFGAAAVLLVSGDIEVTCGDSSLQIQADYWEDLKVDYGEIDSLSCQDGFNPGTRTYGFGSLRLAMGTFHNDQLGSYTLYAYTGAPKYLILESGDKTLVIGMKKAEQTQSIYESLMEKTGT